MNYDVYLTQTFQKHLKILNKKYRHIKDDLSEIIQRLESNPSGGDPIPGWDGEIWKARVASSDMKRGKSGGFRLIYLWKKDEFKVYLLTIYFKGEKETISHKELNELLKKIIANSEWE